MKQLLQPATTRNVFLDRLHSPLPLLCLSLYLTSQSSTGVQGHFPTIQVIIGLSHLCTMQVSMEWLVSLEPAIASLIVSPNEALKSDARCLHPQCRITHDFLVRCNNALQCSTLFIYQEG